MSVFSNLWRLARTGTTFQRTGALDQAMVAMSAPRSLRIAGKVLLWPVQWLGLKGDPNLPPVVRAITALGPSYIKFGQILSTRPDVTGQELSMQLRILQDDLPPFSMAEARKQIEYDLGQTIEEVFTDFSEPIAAASIAQVHKAKMRDTGQDVAVKVRRPGIEKAFRKDIDAFYFVASFIEFFAPKARRLKPRDVVTHFDQTVQGEIDFRLESAAAAEFGANTAKDEGFRVPAVFWGASGSRVMTTEWISGTNFGDIEELRARGINMTEMAERVNQVFLSHALRDGLFHGDMHHGNLKVDEAGNLVALDFGIMGRIDAYTRRVYAEILFGFLSKNYKRVAEVHFEAGYVPADKDVDAFAQALRSIAEPIFGQDASKISMARLLAHLFNVTEQFGMETRTELLLLQRTMVVAEGVGRSLDPNMNMWNYAKPIVEKYITDNLGPKAVIRDLAETAKVLSRFGPLLPRMAEEALIRANATPPDTKENRIPGWMWFLSGVGTAGGVAVLVWCVAVGLA